MKAYFAALITVICIGSTNCYAGQSACRSFNTSRTNGVAMLLLKSEMKSSLARCADYSEFHFSYAYILERLGKYDLALPQYKTAIRLDPTVAKYYGGTADVLMALKDKPNAIRYYKMTIARDYDNPRAIYQLQQLGASASKFRAIKTNFISPANIHTIRGRLSKQPHMLRYGDFYIARTEVSVAQYQQENPAYNPPRGFSDKMPVVNVSFAEAQDFARSQGERLCTAQEWRIVVNKGLYTLSKMNLYKDFFSTPYSTNFGSRTAQIKNLIGNVAEWVEEGARPGFIGGHYSSATLLQASIEKLAQVVTNEGLDGKPYVGLRCCRDVSSK